jgi:hypothetical protein
VALVCNGHQKKHGTLRRTVRWNTERGNAMMIRAFWIFTFFDLRLRRREAVAMAVVCSPA